VVRDHQWFRQWQRSDPSDGLFGFAFLAIDVMAAFTQMLSFRHVRALSAASVCRRRGWVELDRGVARSPRPQAPVNDGAPDADSHAAQRVLLLASA
jgi:hypothetical protein